MAQSSLGLTDPSNGRHRRSELKEQRPIFVIFGICEYQTGGRSIHRNLQHGLGPPSANFLELLAYIIFCELPGLRAKHIRKFGLAHANLITNRHKAGCKVRVIFHQKLDRHHKPVDVVKDECASGTVRFFRLDKVDRMISPMTPRVEMMCCMVSVVEADTIALFQVSNTEKGFDVS